MNDKHDTLHVDPSLARFAEYRCTRTSLYLPGSAGYRDESARQGYYVLATSRTAALRKMRDRFPADVAVDARGTFTVTPWGHR
jgi:hypothetical protein